MADVRDVRLPNGVVLKNVPLAVSQEGVKRQAILAGLAKEEDFALPPAEMREATSESFRQPESMRPLAPTSDEYNKQALKKGFLSPVAFAETLAGFMGLPYAEKEIREFKEDKYKKLGIKDYRPSTLGQRMAGGALESVTDPTSYAFGVSAPVKLGTSLGAEVAGRALPYIKAGVESMTAGSGAVFGEEVGTRIAGETGATSTTGAIGGAIVGGTIPNRTMFGVSMLSKGAGKVYDMTKGAQVSDVTGALPTEQAQKLANDAIAEHASGKIKAIFGDALKANPDLVGEVMRADEFKKILKSDLPASAIFGSNPYIDTVISRLLKDPAFYAKYNDQYQTAKKALEDRKQVLFGTQSEAVETLTNLAKENRSEVTKKSVDKRLAALDARATQLTNKLGTAVDPAKLGAAIDNLVETQEKLARQVTTPLYDDALKYAAQNNVTMPKESVQNIYNFVNDSVNADIFKTFPRLFNEISRNLAPKQIEGTRKLVSTTDQLDIYGNPIQDATEIVTSPATQSFEGMSPQVIDSLKRAVSKELRTVRSDSDYRVLSELKNLFNDGLNSISDKQFVDAYKNADDVFAKTVGVPFTTESVKMIDRAKFAEDVIPKITRNASSLNQFLDVAGDKGVELASTAFRSDFLNKTVKDGVVDPKAASNWFKANQYFKAVNPDLYDELQQTVNDVSKLKQSKVNLEKQYKESAAKQIFELYGSDPTQFFNTLKNPTEYDKFIFSYGRNPDAMDAARSMALSRLTKSANPLEELNSGELAPLYSKLFKGRTKEIGMLLEVTERLNKSVTPSSAQLGASTIEADPIKRQFGISAGQVSSQLRNPIQNLFTATQNIVSKIFQSASDKAYDIEAASVFLNPEAAKAILMMDKAALAYNMAKTKEAGTQAAEAAMKNADTLASKAISILQEKYPQYYEKGQKILRQQSKVLGKQSVKSAVVGAGSMPEQTKETIQQDERARQKEQALREREGRIAPLSPEVKGMLESARPAPLKLEIRGTNR